MRVFGPVPSRRLGRSLGVSPIPAKTCSFSCVYCQLGRTRDRQVRRRTFFERRALLQEIIQAAECTKPDTITFAGDGEPTLCRDLGYLIRGLKGKLSFPVAVITNSSLLHRMDVRQDLAQADILLPSLDAANETLFKAINRPHPTLKLASIVDGLHKLRRQVRGDIWLEIMLVKRLNDHEEHIHQLKRLIEGIEPDRVYCMAPTRPPAEGWVTPPDPTAMVGAQHLLGNAKAVFDVESDDLDLKSYDSAEQAILDISARHPLRLDQAESLAKRLSETTTIEQMIADGKLKLVEYQGHRYLHPKAN